MNNITLNPAPGASTPAEPGSAGVQSSNDKILEVAGQFEALMLTSMMKSMRATLSGDSLAGSTQQDMYQEMMDKEIVESITRGQGLGLKQLLAQQLGATVDAQGVDTQGLENAASGSTHQDPLAGLDLMSRLRVTLGSAGSTDP
ncbi:MAG: rod-binding protein [Granulosicoccus sp.]|nr:rod-binding protein [Granulosicoccus sp.]